MLVEESEKSFENDQKESESFNSENITDKTQKKKKEKEFVCDPTDVILLILITFVSYWTRSFMLEHPDEIVFDEVHFGKFNNHYLTHEHFFDIHPPTAKLIIYGFSLLLQYKGDINYKGKYYDNLDYYGLRQIPALFATFCPPLIYLSCKAFGLSKLASVTASVMVICETSMITESRFLLTDGILHFFTCLSLFTLGLVYFYIPMSMEWNVSVVCSGIAIGLAVSSKYTSMSLFPLCAFIHLMQMLETKTKFDLNFLFELVYRGCLTALPIIIVFFGSFVLHIILIPYHGDMEGFMSREFLNTLVNKTAPNWSNRNRGPFILTRIIELIIKMHLANMGIKASHPYSSKWYQWPFLLGKSVYFWYGRNKSIVCITQPFNVIAGTSSVIICLLLCILYKYLPDWRKEGLKICSIFFVGFLCSLLPFALIGRVLFIYHYIIPLVFGIITFVAAADKLLSDKYKGIVLQLAQFLTIAAFIYWSPFCYGLETDVFRKKWLIKW